MRLMRWWPLTGIVATLPLIVNWSILNLGGYVTDWIYYGDYRDLFSLSFLASAILYPWLMTKQSRFLSLRFTSSFVLILAYLFAAFLPRPMCPERVMLGPTAKIAPRDADDAYSCEVAPPPPPPKPMKFQ